MDEVWKDIPGYEGLYQVSNLGRVRSFGRTVMRNTRWGTQHPYHIAGRVLKILHSQADYTYVHLFDEDGTPTNHKVHRLVAQAFVPNPKHLDEVNHIDEDKDNNRADNLEWITHIDNCNHGTRNERVAKHAKQVEQLTLDGQHVAYYQSAAEAGRQTGIPHSAIYKCCNHGDICNVARGYQWRYKETSSNNGET